jgi:hypothetical protein
LFFLLPLIAKVTTEVLVFSSLPDESYPSLFLITLAGVLMLVARFEDLP